MKYPILLFSLLLLIATPLFADSPLTSTNFSKAYEDQEIVQEAARAKGGLTENLMQYLSNPQNPIDLKLAVINQLSWGHGNNNASTFYSFLNQAEQYQGMDDFLCQAKGDVIICLAYLKALDDYFDVTDALKYARMAKLKQPNSYAVHIICALIEAQQAMDINWCLTYTLTHSVRLNKGLKNDFNEQAKSIIFEYMDLYKGDCG